MGTMHPTMSRMAKWKKVVKKLMNRVKTTEFPHIKWAASNPALRMPVIRVRPCMTFAKDDFFFNEEEY